MRLGVVASIGLGVRAVSAIAAYAIGIANVQGSSVGAWPWGAFTIDVVGLAIVALACVRGVRRAASRRGWWVAAVATALSAIVDAISTWRAAQTLTLDARVRAGELAVQPRLVELSSSLPTIWIAQLALATVAAVAIALAAPMGAPSDQRVAV